MKGKVQPKEKVIATVKIRHAIMGGVVSKRVSNLLTVLELKEDYIECNKNKDAKGLTTDRIRFFVMGKELKNEDQTKLSENLTKRASWFGYFELDVIFWSDSYT